jgi:leucyl-tRNA synthetase
MVLAETYYRDTPEGRREWVHPSDVELQRDARGKVLAARRRADGAEVVFDGIGTMSKSKNNGVDPQELIDKYGADTARFFIIFASPPTDTLEWSDEGVQGSYRFLRRLWSHARGFGAARSERPEAARLDAAHKAARFEIHATLRKANFDLQRHKFNTVASAGMIILNALERLPGRAHGVAEEGMSILLRLLSPITPHLCHHLWRTLGFGEDVMRAPWPEPDSAALEQDEIEYVVQVGGKTRGSLRAPKGADQQALETLVRSSEVARKYIAGKPVRKVIVVPGRLINVVV